MSILSNKAKLEKVCATELKGKLPQLQLLPLDENKSIENLVDPAILREAIKEITTYLINDEKRKTIDGFNPLQELEKLVPPSDKTFGKLIDDVTATWFIPSDSISKLSIALKYEDIIKTKSSTMKYATKSFIGEIKKMLNIRGEKSVDKVFFEEVA